MAGAGEGGEREDGRRQRQAVEVGVGGGDFLKDVFLLQEKDGLVED